MADTFKYNSKKSHKLKTRLTIDSKHEDMLIYFENLQTKVLPKKEKEIIKIQNEIKTLKKKGTLSPTLFLNHTISNLENKITVLKQDIKDIIDHKEENEYYLNTAKILGNYYNDLQNNYIFDENKDKSKNNSIFDYFSNSQSTEPSKIDHFININKSSQKRHEYLNNYLNAIGIQTNTYRVDFFCDFCSANLIIVHSEGCIVCPVCGISVDNIYETSTASYKTLQDTDITPKFAYKRINHFNEWLNQIQGKETTDIPEEVYNKFKIEIRKQRLTFDDIDNQTARNILQKLKFNKYYEHIPYIIFHITNKQPIIITYDVEAKFRSMFKQMQKPFIEFCPTNRVNFLSYAYVLHKFSQLLEQDHLLKSFPLLKSREKLYEQDKLWEKICKRLKWQYIPSI